MLGNKDQFSSPLSFDCSTCKLGKSKSLSFPSHGSHAEHCFYLIHSDVWGISPIISHVNYKYFVTFIDDYTKYNWIYFLHAKSEVLSIFQQFTIYVETQFSSSIKILWSNSGGEYMSGEFMLSSKKKTLLLNVLVHIHLKKMVWLNIKIDICWMFFVLYCFNHLFHLNSRLKHYLRLFI